MATSYMTDISHVGHVMTSDTVFSADEVDASDAFES